jgi:sigma-B regulation protein RsbU (phosphoserine phosphatase)
MALDNPDAWKKGCDCQGFYTQGKLTEAYNEIRCSRLEELESGRGGLRIHASAPLRSGDNVLGILNVATPAWEHFSARNLALLANMGAQMGIALERARLFDLLNEKRVHEQAALLKLSNQLLGQLDLDDILNYIVIEVKDLLQTDASAVFLLNEQGEYLTFRAVAGWRQDPVREKRQIPADETSASGWVVYNQQPLVYHRDDPDREIPVWTSEWLHGERFQSVAVVPMVSDEHTIGTLAVNMREHRIFEDDEIRFLQLMANQAAVAIEQGRLHKLEVRRQRLEKELAVGREIQLSLLPKSCPVVDGWQFCDIYQAARQVGGDFYDFFYLPDQDDQMALLIGDVSDKGVPAALFMGVCRTIIRSAALAGHSPSKTLTIANKQIINDSQSDMFLSVFYGVLEMGTGKLLFCNAGHNPPLRYRPSTDTFCELKSDGIVLGIIEEIELKEDEVDIAPCDILIFYTDGVTEAMNADFEEFGLDRLHFTIASFADRDAADILQAVVAAVNEFTDQVEQSDDFTLYIIKRL